VKDQAEAPRRLLRPLSEEGARDLRLVTHQELREAFAAADRRAASGRPPEDIMQARFGGVGCACCRRYL
jgi:hypothetical protein